jgi:hypothetical protein
MTESTLVAPIELTDPDLDAATVKILRRPARFPT